VTGAPRTRGPVLSLRAIATAAAVVLTVSAVLAVGAQSERAARAALRHEIEARLQLVARNLAASSSDALLADFPELTLHPLVREMRQQQPDLAMAVVVDHRHRIVGHADARAIGSAFTPPPGLGGADGGPAAPGEQLRLANGMLVARAPVLHRNGGRVIGAVFVGVPLASIERTVRAARREQAVLLGLFALAAAALAFLLMSTLLRPIAVLRAGLERIGRGDLDSPIPVRGHTELALLAGTVNEMAEALKRGQAEMVERERLAHELELAREIQRSLLPAREVVAGPFEIRGDQNAAAEVGGDCWDVFSLPDGRIGIAIADVAGKGLAGCLVMSMLSALLRALRASYASPAALIVALDERLSESMRPGVFVTLTYGILDPRTGRMIFASAGHNPLLVWRRRTGEVETRASRGVPIGAIRGGSAIRATVRDETLDFEPGDVCLQYTDGYSEAFRGGSGEQFGVDRLCATLAGHAARGGAAVLHRMPAALREWAGPGPGMDDETVVVIACDPAAAAFARTSAAETPHEAEVRTALTLLGEAERTGPGLAIPAHLPELSAILPWLRGLPGFREAPAEEIEMARLALYELCANIVEHGCTEDRRSGLELWWIAAEPGHPEHGPCGSFVIRDVGRPFRPGEHHPLDFSDPAVRARGRGLGLEILHRATAGVRYFPATPRGNVTELAWGSGPGRERIAA